MNDNVNEKNDLQISISCPVETKVLQVIRTFITSIAREMGFNEEDAAKIEIAVDEACANVVCHAYNSQKSKVNNSKEQVLENGNVSGTGKNFEIKMNISICKDNLKIDILDYGFGTKNGFLTGVHEIEEYIKRDKKHGLGTYIIQKFMDEVQFDFLTQKGTKVSMKKYLPASRISS